MSDKYFDNFGDKNFFEYGRLVRPNREGADNTEYQILFCDPYSDLTDENGDPMYQAGVVCVDISDFWIDEKGVLEFVGLDEDYKENNPELYAIDCLSYYGPENFGVTGLTGSPESEWHLTTKQEILDNIEGWPIKEGSVRIKDKNPEL